jgi:hypothetical protein
VRQSVFNPGYSVSLVGGYDADHTVAEVAFDGVCFDAARVTARDQLGLITRHTRHLSLA